MQTTHKEQIAFLKKKLKLGLKGKDLFTLYKEKFCLGIKSYERRLAAARAELNIGKKPSINWVLVNIVHDGKDPQHEAPKDPLQTGAKSPPVSTGGKQENTLLQNAEKTPQPTYEKATPPKREKPPRPTRVHAAEAEVAAAAEELLCMTVLSTEECLLMLSRFALGQYVRSRHFACGGEVVEVRETPPFNARRTAVMAILKYHEAMKDDKSFKGELGYDPTKYVALTTQEILNMTDERMMELTRQILPG